MQKPSPRSSTIGALRKTHCAFPIRMGSPMRNALSLASTQAPARPYFSSSDVMTRCSAPAELPSVPETRPSSGIGSPLHSGALAYATVAARGVIDYRFADRGYGLLHA